MPRILVLGPSGGGKSTLASNLADILNVPCIELDALNWEPGFIPSSEFPDRVSKAVTSSRSWIVDGNNRAVRPVLDPLVTHVILLNLSFWLVTWRLIKRTFQRWWKGELLWGKCRESLYSVFEWGDEGLFYFHFRNFWSRKKRLLDTIDAYKNRGKVVWILNKPAEVEELKRAVREKKSM